MEVLEHWAKFVLNWLVEMKEKNNVMRIQIARIDNLLQTHKEQLGAATEKLSAAKYAYAIQTARRTQQELAGRIHALESLRRNIIAGDTLNEVAEGLLIEFGAAEGAANEMLCLTTNPTHKEVHRIEGMYWREAGVITRAIQNEFQK